MGVHNFQPYVAPPPPQRVVVAQPQPAPQAARVEPPVPVRPVFILPNITRLPPGNPVPNTHNQVNQDTKKALINKVIYIRNEADNQKSKVVRHLSDSIRKINQQAKEALQKIETFINLCEDIIREITQVNSVLKAEFYGPLETILLSPKVDLILGNMIAPLIETCWPDNLFTYIPSTFPHELYNNNSNSIGFTENNKIILYPLKKEVQNNQFAKTACFMGLGEDKILVTGGQFNNAVSGQASIFDVKTSQKVKNLPNLKHPRQLHGMGWVYGNLIVIGGKDNENPMSSVEVLKNNNWEEFPPLKCERHSFSTITLNKSLWVIGGVERNVLDTIERFVLGQDNYWESIKIESNLHISKPWLVGTGNSILIIGGKTSDGERRGKIFQYDPSIRYAKKIDDLDDPAYFDSNQSYVEGKLIKHYGDDKNLVSLDMVVLHR